MSANPSQPLPIASVVDHVYVAIRQRIIDGDLPRGSRLHQEDLAADLGVSRTPVREALRRLAAEGLVQMQTNRGARVADFQGADMRSPTEARMVVEPGAARIAAEREASVERMRAAIATHRRMIPDVKHSFDTNREFHLALVEASGNPFLIQFSEMLWVSRIGEPIYARQVATADDMRMDADEHEGIMLAIEAGDPARAETLARRHLEHALERLLAAI